MLNYKTKVSLFFVCLAVFVFIVIKVSAYATGPMISLQSFLDQAIEDEKVRGMMAADLTLAGYDLDEMYYFPELISVLDYMVSSSANVQYQVDWTIVASEVQDFIDNIDDYSNAESNSATRSKSGSGECTHLVKYLYYVSEDATQCANTCSDLNSCLDCCNNLSDENSRNTCGGSCGERFK